jgi:hypothetical protein
VLTQTGCSSGQKCSWIEDTASLGHVGCAPNGPIPAGGACTYGAPGATGYDNCVAGTACMHGVCETVCDQNGGSPMCDANHTCEVYSGFLGPAGSEAAGVCDPSCNPLDDNDFDGPGPLTKPGTVCGIGQGCYGFWSSTKRSHFSCAPIANPTLFHRSACTGGCTNGGGSPFLNGCAGGYMPLITDDTTGANTYSCMAFCKPADCSLGACTSSIGAPPHQCNNTDAAGTFDSADNGDQCVYGWWFEEGNTGTVLLSQFSNTTGICLDHTRYHLADATGMSTSTTNWPACNTLPITASSTTCHGALNASPADLSGCTAVDFGCVSTTTGGVTTQFTTSAPPHFIARPRMPYSAGRMTR